MSRAALTSDFVKINTPFPCNYTVVEKKCQQNYQPGYEL
nr:MAG TPA: hypothetical protein [Caudoviricetes sp.]